MKVSLKGKFGENPALSRNCNFGVFYKKPLREAWEGVKSVDDKPGDLPVLSTHQRLTWRWAVTNSTTNESNPY